MKITRILLPALVALASPALLAAQQPAAGETPWQPAAVSDYLDSARVVAELVRLPATREPRHAWVFSIDYTPEGAASGVRMYFTRQEADGPQAEVARILLANARPRPASPVPRAMLITAVPGPRPLLRVPSETAPTGRDASQVNEAMHAAVARLGEQIRELRGRQVIVQVRMRVGENGVPTEASVMSPGIPELDQEAVRIAQLFRFGASRIEGRPAAAWVQIPLAFQFD